MSNSPASNVTLTALETEKREDPKTKTCTGRGTAKPLTEYSKGRRKRIKCKAPGVRTENFLYARNGNLKEDGRWQYFYDYQNRLTRIHEPSTGEEGPILVRCPGTTNRHRRGGPVDLSCFGRATVYVDKLLTELPTKIQTTAERGYLEEALICFRNKAFRAAVVMCWNLAFDHLCEFVLKEPARLADFNTQLPKSFPKADLKAVRTRDHFTELKEFQVLQVCDSANIISKSLHNILTEKLTRRNTAAHPSGTVTSQPTAEEFIGDLVENVVLKLT